MRLDIYESGQAIAVSSSDNYTLLDSQVAINGQIYEKKYLRSKWATSQLKGESLPPGRLSLSFFYLKRNSTLSFISGNYQWDEIFFNGGGSEAGLEEAYERISSAIR